MENSYKIIAATDENICAVFFASVSRCDGYYCFKKQWCPIPYEKRRYLSFPPAQKAQNFKFAVPQDFYSKVKTASEIAEFHEQQKYKFWQRLMQDGPQFILTEDLLDV